jgi:hypoxanthine phosphoribosyltransferase
MKLKKLTQIEHFAIEYPLTRPLRDPRMAQLSMTQLYSRQTIATRIEAIARQIEEDYQGRELLLVAVLKGSFLFIADLARALQIPVQIDFVRLASYGSETKSSGIIEIRKDLEMSIKGRNVLVVEDIVDSGLTLEALRDLFLLRDPASLRICTLIDKTAHRETDIQVDYIGFTMDDGFIVGYGLDLDERYRDLPDIHLVQLD